ncbi:hypothetical protein QJS66_15265 [Kocuria rhizophila]|nr:hypothetical protein QJS66_15265 [Kocuria rhizophila]
MALSSGSHRPVGIDRRFRSAGGQASYSTISRWAPRAKRRRCSVLERLSQHWWRAGGRSGPVGCQLTFFGGNIVGMFIFPH